MFGKSLFHAEHTVLFIDLRDMIEEPVYHLVLKFDEQSVVEDLRVNLCPHFLEIVFKGVMHGDMLLEPGIVHGSHDLFLVPEMVVEVVDDCLNKFVQVVLTIHAQ